MHSTHLTPETVLDFLEQRLDEGQESEWIQHINECARCSRYLTEWQDFLNLIKRSNLQTAPQRDMERAIRIFQQSRERSSSIRRVLADTIFDTFTRAVLVGARGIPAATRDLVLQAEDFHIHIQIRGEGEQRQILGQILSRTREDFISMAQFHLLRNGERLQAVTADKLGEFHFIDVPEGELNLQVDLPHLTIVGALNIK
jgi:hypothetical protein